MDNLLCCWQLSVENGSKMHTLHLQVGSSLLPSSCLKKLSDAVSNNVSRFSFVNREKCKIDSEMQQVYQ